MVLSHVNKVVLAEKFCLVNHPGVLDQIKILIRAAVSEHADLSRVFSSQDPEKLAEIRNRVSRGFPNIFEDPSLDREELQDRMRFAMCYSEKAFNTMRHTARVKTVKKETPSSGSGAVRRSKERCRSSSPYVQKHPAPRTSPATQPKRVSPRLSAIPRRNTFSGDAMRASSNIVRDPTPPLPPYSSPPSTPEAPSGAQSNGVPLPDPSSIPTEAAAAPTSKTHPELPSPSSQTTQSTTTSSSLPFDYRIGEVAAFLRSCEPNMQFLLNSFVSYGCRNRQFLTVVAKWSDNKIDEFLKKVVTHTPPAQPTLEMELLILRNHFQVYFDKQAVKNEVRS